MDSLLMERIAEREESKQAPGLLQEELTSEIIGAAMSVHRELGPGLLESADRQCMCHELALRRIPFRSEVPLRVRYKGIQLDCGDRIDVIVDGRVVVELKSVESVSALHEAQ